MFNSSNYLENKIVDAVLRGQAFAPPATLYFSYLKCDAVRANSTAVTLNMTLGVLCNDSRIHLYKVTTAGTTASSLGSLFTGTADEVVADGTAVLTEQTSPLDAGTAAVEPTGGSYARASLACSLTNFAGTQGAGTTAVSSGTTRTTSNNVVVTWPTPSASWGSQWGVAVYDAASAGNMLMWGPLTAIQQMVTGDTITFAAGAATFQLVGAWKNGFANSVIDWLFRGRALLTLGADIFVGLMTDTPSHTVAGAEVVGGGYARVAVPRTLAAWSGTQAAGSTAASTGTTGQSSNNASVVFPVPSVGWGTVQSTELFDSASGGVSLFFGALSAPKTIIAGNSVPFAPDGLRVRVS